MDEQGTGPAHAPSGGSGRILIWGAVTLVVAAALALFALLPTRSEPSRSPTPADERDRVGLRDTPQAVPSPPPPGRVAVTPSAAPPPAATARSIPPLAKTDFFTREVDPSLLKMHEVTSGGGRLSIERMKEVYQLGKDHPGDPRPHLVMGEDAMNRGWDGFAVKHYERAVREDPRAREDPRMLRNLVDIAAGKYESAAAASALTKIYGPAAIPAVEEALAAAGDKGEADRVERLSALSRSLSTSTP